MVHGVTDGPPLSILVVANLWPSPARPAFGSFVAARVDALRAAGHRVDVVHVADVPNPVRRYAGLAAGALAAGVRARRRPPERRPQIVEAHIAYPTGLLAWPAARLAGAPLVLFAHGSDVLQAARRSRLEAAAARRLFRTADLVVANSAYLAGETRRLIGPGGPPLLVASPGIAVDRFRAPADPPPRRPDRIAVVANLNHRKGIDVLIEAIARIEHFGGDLVIVGDGPERDRLHRLAATRRLAVTFTGALPHDAVAGWLWTAGVLAVPSRAEPLGLAALEGMAAGCVVVATRTGGLAETVRDGETGFSCPPDDPAGLAAALQDGLVAAADPVRRSALADPVEGLLAEHDIAVATERTVAAYRRLAR